jgi:hypothetical protein
MYTISDARPPKFIREQITPVMAEVHSPASPAAGLLAFTAAVTQIQSANPLNVTCLRMSGLSLPNLGMEVTFYWDVPRDHMFAVDRTNGKRIAMGRPRG